MRNELEGDGYPVDEGWEARMMRFVTGADLLIHDAMYTGPESSRSSFRFSRSRPPSPRSRRRDTVVVNLDSCHSGTATRDVTAFDRAAGAAR